jgi:hypothetical protein
LWFVLFSFLPFQKDISNLSVKFLHGFLCFEDMYIGLFFSCVVVLNHTEKNVIYIYIVDI